MHYIWMDTYITTMDFVVVEGTGKWLLGRSDTTVSSCVQRYIELKGNCKLPILQKARLCFEAGFILNNAYSAIQV